MSKKQYSGEGWSFESADSKSEKEFKSIPVSQQLIRVLLEKRRGKSVTCIRGFSHTTGELKNIERELKKHLNCGGTSINNEIELQGDFRERVLIWLHERGYARSK